MPEIQDPPRKSFGASLGEALKPFEATLKTASPAPEPDKVVISATDPKPEPVKVEPKVEAKPEPKAEVVSDPDDDIISGKRNPKGEDFKRVKTAAAEAAKQRDEIKSRAETYEKELVELKKAPKHNAELISKIEKERDEYKSKYDQVALAYDPDFNASYKTRVDAVLESVKKLVPADRAEDLAMVLQMPDSERKRKALLELTEDLDQFSVNDIAQAKRDVSNILNERSSRLAKSESELAALVKKKAEDFESYKANRAKLFDSVLEKTMAQNPVFKKKEGDSPEVKAWNEVVEETAKTAKSIYMGEMEGDEVRAEAALQAASNPVIFKSWMADKAKLDEALATIAKLQASSPGMGDSRGETKTAGSLEGSFAKAIGRALKG